MASPQPGGGNPRMPRQPGVPELVVDPIVPGFKKPNPGMPRGKVKLPKPKKDRLGRPLIDPGSDMPFPGPRPYAPIKQTKAVNTVYKTY